MNEAAVLNVVDKIADKLAVPATEILSAYAQSGGVMLLPELIVSGRDNRSAYVRFNASACVFYALASKPQSIRDSHAHG